MEQRFRQNDRQLNTVALMHIRVKLSFTAKVLKLGRQTHSTLPLQFDINGCSDEGAGDSHSVQRKLTTNGYCTTPDP